MYNVRASGSVGAKWCRALDVTVVNLVFILRTRGSHGGSPSTCAMGLHLCSVKSTQCVGRNALHRPQEDLGMTERPVATVKI